MISKENIMIGQKNCSLTQLEMFLQFHKSECQQLVFCMQYSLCEKNQQHFTHDILGNQFICINFR